VHQQDRNATAIVSALRQAGCVVRFIACPVGVGGVPDVLVGFRGKTFLLELKVKGGRLNPKQVEFHQTWNGGPLAVVRSIEEALRAVGLGEAVAA
jgi:hypothetical protein